VKSLIVTGTDTGVGKTVLSSLLMAALPQYRYWKPIQSGIEEGSDSATVQQLSECSVNRIEPETYIFTKPLSPHLASAIDGVKIDTSKLIPPYEESLVIEGAGGLMVPLTDDVLYIDIFQKWNIPVLLACRSTLGTINHSLLSIEAMRRRNIPIFGCVLIGDVNPENKKAIEHYGGVPVVGEIPLLMKIHAGMLRMVYGDHFQLFDSMLRLSA